MSLKALCAFLNIASHTPFAQSSWESWCSQAGVSAKISIFSKNLSPFLLKANI